MKGIRKILPTLTLAALAAVCGLAMANAATDPPAPADSAPVDPGIALIQTRCVMCHDAGFVLQARKPTAAWRDLIDEMVSRGAQVSDSEADQIQTYLEKNQSIPPPAP